MVHMFFFKTYQYHSWMTEETGVGYVRDPPVYLHPGDKVGTEAGGALHERRASMNSWEDGKVFQEFLAK